MRWGGGVTLQLHIVYRRFPEKLKTLRDEILSYIRINMATLSQTCAVKQKTTAVFTPTADGLAKQK